MLQPQVEMTVLVGASNSLRKNRLYSSEQAVAFTANANLAELEIHLANVGNLDRKDEDGLAWIHYAACYGDMPLIRRLREAGADMNLLDGGSPPWKPIHYAIFHRQHEAEQVLRTLGAEVPLPILKRIVHETPRACETMLPTPLRVR